MVSPKPKLDLLYICHRVPFPPNKGDKIRTFNQIKYLCRNWHIDLVSFADDPKDLKYQSELEKFCRRVFLFPLNPLRAKVKGIKSFIAGKSISQGYYFDANANKRVHHLFKKIITMRFCVFLLPWAPTFWRICRVSAATRQSRAWSWIFVMWIQTNGTSMQKKHRFPCL